MHNLTRFPEPNRYHSPDGSDMPALQGAGGPGRLLRATGERGPSCVPGVLGAAFPGSAAGVAVPPESPARPDPAALFRQPRMTISGVQYIFMLELHSRWVTIG